MALLNEHLPHTIFASLPPGGRFASPELEREFLRQRLDLKLQRRLERYQRGERVTTQMPVTEQVPPPGIRPTPLIMPPANVQLFIMFSVGVIVLVIAFRHAKK